MRYVLLLSVLFLTESVWGQVLSMPPSANEGAVVMITYDEVPDISPGFDQVVIDFGDGTSVTTNAFGRSAHLVFQHVYAEDSRFTNYTVTVTEEDFEMGSTETTGELRVVNVPPMAHLASEYVVTAGRLTASIAVDDPGNDPVTAQVSFGDGSSQSFDLGTGPGRSIFLNHTYNATNNYTLSVSVRDDEGGLLSGTAQVRVTGTVPAPRLSVYSFAGVVLTGELGRSYDIQKTDTAEPTDWITVATLTLTNNPQLWIDSSSTNSTKRFYRAIAR